MSLHMEATCACFREDPHKTVEQSRIWWQDLGTGTSGGDCFFVTYSNVIFNDRGANHARLHSMLGWVWNPMCYHADPIAKDIMFGENIVASCGETISKLTLDRLLWFLRKAAPAGSPPVPDKDADNLDKSTITTQLLMVLSSLHFSEFLCSAGLTRLSLPLVPGAVIWNPA